MSTFTDAQCFKCGKDIKDGDEVITVSVNRGHFNAIEDTVVFDPYGDDSIFHEECYLAKDEAKETPPKLTQEQIQDYLNNDGMYCPYCGSSNITALIFDSEGCHQPVRCEECDREWRDIYRRQLIGVEEIKS